MNGQQERRLPKFGAPLCGLSARRKESLIASTWLMPCARTSILRGFSSRQKRYECRMRTIGTSTKSDFRSSMTTIRLMRLLRTQASLSPIAWLATSFPASIRWKRRPYRRRSEVRPKSVHLEHLDLVGAILEITRLRGQCHSGVPKARETSRSMEGFATEGIAGAVLPIC